MSPFYKRIPGHRQSVFHGSCWIWARATKAHRWGDPGMGCARRLRERSTRGILSFFLENSIEVDTALPDLYLDLARRSSTAARSICGDPVDPHGIRWWITRRDTHPTSPGSDHGGDPRDLPTDPVTGCETGFPFDLSALSCFPQIWPPPATTASYFKVRNIDRTASKKNRLHPASRMGRPKPQLLAHQRSKERERDR
jgi:hypothetical protein